LSDIMQPDAATDTTTDEPRPDAENVDTPDVAQTEPPDPEPADDADTFPREYVEKLRKESAGYRDKANTAQARASELESTLTALERTRRVESLAREMGLPEPFWSRVTGDDDDAIIKDIYALLDGVKSSKRVSGDVGQGRRDTAPAQVNLIGLLRGER
jgi:hypothetical protein